MTFEEFFNKKKINLTTLQQGDAALFIEFKEHYEAMGEKSFDHTKKYWFNKLRRVYPLPAGADTGKVRIENKLVEQTVTESLLESAPPAEKAVGTTPAGEAAVQAAPPAGFKPRFKPGMAKPAPAQEKQEIPDSTPPPQENTPFNTGEETKPAEPAKPGFKPRFKAGATISTPASGPEKKEEKPAGNVQEPTPAAATPKPGFKPRFKAGLTGAAQPPEAEKQQEYLAEEQPQEATSPVDEAPKPGFKAGVTTATPQTPNKEPTIEHGQAPTGDSDAAVPPADEIPIEPMSTPAAAPQKSGFKPRFKAGLTDKAKEAEEKGEQPASATATPEVNAAAEQQQAIREEQPLADMRQVKPDFEKEKEQVQEAYSSPERENQHLNPEEGIADLENKEVKKPAYKPRFNPKNLKPKSEE